MATLCENFEQGRCGLPCSASFNACSWKMQVALEAATRFSQQRFTEDAL